MKSWEQRERARQILSKEAGYVRKPHGDRLRVALAFPNTYWVGMSNLGFQTIYRLFNAHDDVVCERVFLPPNDDPFKKADAELAKLPGDVGFVLVDIHAETTSEKVGFGWYLDGRVTAVVGTHTHVTTADERVLPNGTAYITDVGMTGPHNGIIGMEREAIIKKFIDGLPARFEVASGDVQMNAVVIETDDAGPRNEAGRLRAKSIARMRLRAD